jgi:methionyl aminopeptidase
MSNDRPITIKSPSELGYMREAGHVVAEVLGELERAVAPGITTWELDRLSEDLTYKRGAKPAFKGLYGFPNCLCISVNHEVVHGIPSKKRVLQAGDLVKLDFGAIRHGYLGDSARTVPVGKASAEAMALLQATRESLEQAIQKMVPGNRLSDIGSAVQQYVEARGYSVVRALGGHGIGQALHEGPHVPNYDFTRERENLTNHRLREGMVLAVEPMVNMGTFEVKLLSDKWTMVTTDGKLSAHFEHTIAITSQGPEVLTV